MDRRIVYAGQVPLQDDILVTNLSAMTALGQLIQDILVDTGTQFTGLACTPGTGLQVSVAPGAVYQYTDIDTSSYGDLPANSQLIFQQGINLGLQLFDTPAPTTSGESINYLIQGQFLATDTDDILLPYLNTSNINQTWQGPNNSGTSQPTLRQGVINLGIVAGTPATTGSQVTPSPSSGFVGLWVISVAYGASTISQGDITQYDNGLAIDNNLNYVLSKNIGGLTATTATTGSASSLPSAPAGYVEVPINGTPYKIPYYNL